MFLVNLMPAALHPVSGKPFEASGSMVFGIWGSWCLGCRTVCQEGLLKRYKPRGEVFRVRCGKDDSGIVTGRFEACRGVLPKGLYPPLLSVHDKEGFGALSHNDSKAWQEVIADALSS